MPVSSTWASSGPVAPGYPPPGYQPTGSYGYPGWGYQPMAPLPPPRPHDRFPKAFWIGPIAMAVLVVVGLMMAVSVYRTFLSTPYPTDCSGDFDTCGWGYVFQVFSGGLILLGLVGLFIMAFLPAWLASLICAIAGATSYRPAPRHQHILIWLAAGLGTLITTPVLIGLANVWLALSDT